MTLSLSTYNLPLILPERTLVNENLSCLTESKRSRKVKGVSLTKGDEAPDAVYLVRVGEEEQYLYIPTLCANKKPKECKYPVPLEKEIAITIAKRMAAANMVPYIHSTIAILTNVFSIQCKEGRWCVAEVHEGKLVSVDDVSLKLDGSKESASNASEKLAKKKNRPCAPWIGIFLHEGFLKK